MTYDVFISHAWEDKDTVVRDLAVALQEHGLSVWYDEFVLRIGDSLRQAIDRGIANSKFGIVVLSEAFFRKQWTQYELDGLVHMSMHERRKQVCLPIWHKISVNEVTANSPSLANVLALRTSDYSIAQIAAEIAAVVRPAGS
ncbi:toll/interleukin-1 receptor domain-containing protein [Micromonospora sp. NPDC005413]|uniref:toll/interleukin-1 receptor domain-containing protein n=1 Tax=unclassified Micromonospora TaxID=2617518 RepID=UPI0033B64D12